MKNIFTSLLLFLFCASTNAQTWTSKSDVPGIARRNTVGFSINGYGYLCQGGEGSSASATHFNDLYQYDPSTDSWNSKANFPGTARRGGVAFTVGAFAYSGMGWDNSTTYYDMYRYNPINDSWDTISSYPGNAGREAFCIADSNSAYVGGGQVGTNSTYDDFWQYLPDSNLWVQKANIPFGNRANGVSLISQGKIYMGLGNTSNTFYNDFWQYLPDSNLWVQKANFPGNARMSAVYFELEGKFIVGGGTGGAGNIGFDDYYQYDPVLDQWDTLGNFPIANYSRGAYFSLNNKGYIAGGLSLGNNQKETLEFSIPSTTSIKKSFTNDLEITVYPNPSVGMLTVIDHVESNKKEPILCYDVNGKLVLSFTSTGTKTELNISSLESGTYFIRYKSIIKKVILTQ